MRLSDVFEHLGLSVYPIAALVLFVGAFAVILYRTMRMSKKASAMHGRLPLEDGEPQQPRFVPAGKEATR